MKLGNIRTVLEILTGLAAIFALVLAFQSNRIAKQANTLAQQQLSPNVILLSSDYANSNTDISSVNIYKPHCLHKIRIANLGSMSDSLIGYEATLSYKEKSVTWFSDESYITEMQVVIGEADSTNNNTPVIKNFSSIILSKWNGTFKYADEYSESVQQLPTKFEGSSVQDLYMQVDFVYENPKAVLSPTIVRSGGFDSNRIAQYSKVDVFYKMNFASGKELYTQKMDCHYLADVIFTE